MSDERSSSPVADGFVAGSSSALSRGPQAGRRVVAVVGAATFLGRNLVALLEQDDRVARVVVVDSENARTAGPKTRYYGVDRTDPSSAARLSEIFAAERVAAVVHLGFLEHPVRTEAWAHELESVGTMHLLNACREQGVQRLVMASSTALYGPRGDNPNFLTEQHPLRGLPDAPFFADKIDAELQVQAFAGESPSRCVTILRMAPLLGPNVDNYVSRWLAKRWVPVLLGYDPLVQMLHEADALAALKLALDGQVPGVFNIAAPGVLPISTVVRLLGARVLPVPYLLARRATGVLWWLGLSEVPAPFAAFLRHVCVADGERARQELGFRAGYTTRETVTEFSAALRLRQAHLLGEAMA